MKGLRRTQGSAQCLEGWVESSLILLLQAFEKTLAQWMEQFHALLTYDNASLAEPSSDAESALDATKAAVCQNINLLIGRDEEEFEPFLERFVNAVWTQLVSVTLKPGQVSYILGHTAALWYAWVGAWVEPFLERFVNAVWMQLVSVTRKP